MSAPTVKEITSALKKMQILSINWIPDNKLVLKISKTKSIVFGTKHALSSKPQLNLVMNNIAASTGNKAPLYNFRV